MKYALHLPQRMLEPKDPRLDQAYIDNVLKKPPVVKNASSPWKFFIDGLLLNVGCGCNNSSYLYARDFPEAHVIGIDSDPAAIEQAKRYYLRGELEGVNPLSNLEFRVGSVHKLARTFGQKAAFISVEDALHHFDPIGEALSQIFHSLRHGGIFSFEDLDRESIFKTDNVMAWYALRAKYEGPAFVDAMLGEDNVILKGKPSLDKMMAIVSTVSFMAAYTLDEMYALLSRAGFARDHTQIRKIDKDRYKGAALKP